MTKRLLILNGLAIIFAVIHHTIDWLLTAMFWWTDRYRDVSVPNYDLLGGPIYYSIRVIDQVVVIGVAAFLIVSGYYIIFASGQSQTRLSWSVVWNRILKLVPPYLLWSFVVLALNFEFGDRLTWNEFLYAIFNGGVIGPYFYIPLLIQLYIFSPLIVAAIKKNWKLTLGFALLLQVPVIYASYLALFRVSAAAPEWFMFLFRDWPVPTYLLWFVVGASIAWKLADFKQFMQAQRGKFLVLLGITFILSLVEWVILRDLTQREWVHVQVTLTYRLYSLVILPLLLAFDWKNSRLSNWLSKISARSFGIYMMHVPLMLISAKVTYHVAPFLLSNVLIFMVFLAVIGVGVPYLSMLVLEKIPFLNRFYTYIFG